MDENPLPNHLIITDRVIRKRSAKCKICKARVFIGEYEDPNRGDEVLTEWINRHKHGEYYE